MESDPSNILLEALLIVVLLLLNAFFSASEMAIVSVNKNKINHLAGEGDKKASQLLKLLSEPSRLLATVQVGITFAGFLASASAATSISKYFSVLLENLGIPGADEVAVIIITVLLSYFTLVFGELLPKRVALQHSEEIAMFVVKPILITSKLTLPFVKLLTSSTNMLVKIFGIHSDNLEEKVSEEEIRMMIDVGEETGVINETEKEMIDGIFEFDDTIAKEIMTPRTNAFIINILDPVEELIDEVLEEQYSRIPIYEDDIDNIIGILYMKDLFIQMRKGNITTEVIRELLRTPYFVPESKNIDALFKELQATKNHMAILIDEYGGFSGIVTIEDLIEEVMGNILDEYDENDDPIKQLENNAYLINGLVSIDDVNDSLHLKLPSENFDTIGGFVIDLLGSIPHDGEKPTIEYDEITFKVEKVLEKRIEKLKIVTK